jgi:hypothetical protein
MAILKIFLILAGLFLQTAAFGTPQLFAANKASCFLTTSFVSQSILLGDEGLGNLQDAAIQSTQAIVDTARVIEETGAGEGFGGILRNIAIAITSIVFLGAGLTLLTASVIIPAAAKELETECKELAPELWDQYTGLLQDGETMGNRPDLMQELGQKLQPLVDAKIERQFASQKERGVDVSNDEAAWKALDNLNNKIPTPTASAPPSEPVIDIGGQWDDDIQDAEIVKKDEKK